MGRWAVSQSQILRNRQSRDSDGSEIQIDDVQYNLSVRLDLDSASR